MYSVEKSKKFKVTKKFYYANLIFEISNLLFYHFVTIYYLFFL